MMISNSISNQYAGIQAIGQQPHQINQQNIQPTAPGETVSISSNAQQMRDKERDIANRYDVTNMSEKEMVSMANELKENGLIDTGQHLDMTLEFGRLGSEHLGLENTSDTKKNYIEHKKNALEFAIQNGTTAIDIQKRQSTLTLLEQMKNLRNS